MTQYQSGWQWSCQNRYDGIPKVKTKEISPEDVSIHKLSVKELQNAVCFDVVILCRLFLKLLSGTGDVVHQKNPGV